MWYNKIGDDMKRKIKMKPIIGLIITVLLLIFGIIYIVKTVNYHKTYDYKLGKPLGVSIRIWEKDKTRRDLDNQATSVLDALVRAGVIEDDSVRVVQKLNVELAGFDKKVPRAEIEIWGLDDEKAL